MAAQTSYTFYGVVEDGFVFNGTSYYPEPAGYTAGQKITGSLTLTGSVAATWISLPEDARFLGIATDLAQAEVNFFFPQASSGDWTGAYLTSNLSLGSTDDQRPLEDFRATLANEFFVTKLLLDQLGFGGAWLTYDDSQPAIVSGAWVPAGVTPNLVYGTREADILRPSASLSLVWGGRGEDDIRVRSGEAFVWGGEGDDTIRGNAGRDFIWGGIGDDIINGKGGDDFLNGQFGDDVIDGGSGNDRIWGGPGFDLIRGGSGDDILDGGGGLDTVLGGAGNDFIVSGHGNIDESYELERSISKGGSGDDIILAANDAILTGGSGADTFVLGLVRFIGDPGFLNGLNVTDFQPGVDRLSIIAGESGRYDTFEEIIAAGVQVGSDVVFNFFPELTDDLPSLVLEEVQLSRLSPGDFIFGDFLI